MGEQFLRRQARSFRHCHDAAFDRMKIPNLISATRQDIMAREFRCDSGDARVAPEADADVVLCRRSDGVDVVVGSRIVGAVASSEIASLRPALDTGCGMLRARVSSRSAITPSFVVRLQVNP
jgi:hypothetical protein